MTTITNTQNTRKFFAKIPEHAYLLLQITVITLYVNKCNFEMGMLSLDLVLNDQ